MLLWKWFVYFLSVGLLFCFFVGLLFWDTVVGEFRDTDQWSLFLSPIRIHASESSFKVRSLISIGWCRPRKQIHVISV